LRQQRREDRSIGTNPSDKSAGPRRARSFGQLLRQFLGLLSGHRLAIGFALATLTVATVLHLLPPLATKLVVDHVLVEQPLPPWWTSRPWLPTDRYATL
jgi:ATP-binding cassette subfamily B protein/subfamily B ATP-binding cassette protein MsbA